MLTGTSIGPYTALAKLGEGGMGEVCRARDSKSKREVAIKVLPPEVAADPERLGRFQREAEVLASLNHPNLAQIYEFEDGALVMELVDGEDLSEHMRRGPIPIDEALPIARQVAEAREAAHDAGIIHRDLKPANIKVRATGADLKQIAGFESADVSPINVSSADDGRMLFSNAQGIQAVSANGGPIQRILDAANVSGVHVLPGSRELLYSRGTRLQSEQPRVNLRDLRSGQETVLTDGLSPRFVWPNLVLWLNGTTISGARVDLAAPTHQSPPVPLLEAVTNLAGFAQSDVSEDGTAIYVPASTAGQPRSTLALRTPAGQLRSLHSSERQFSDPRVSPDGRRLALHISDDENDVSVFDLERGALTPLWFHPAEDETPAWSPDGHWIAFSGASRSGNARAVFRRRADDSGSQEVLWTDAEHTHVTDWSPVGRSLLLEASHPERRADVSRNGTTLFFRTECTLESARFRDAKETARADPPVTVLEDKLVQPQGATHIPYGVLPDGSLIVFQPPDPFAASWLSTSVIGIFNWVEEVRQKLPSP